MLVLAAALTLVGLNAEVIAGWLGFEFGLAGATLLYAGTGRLITTRVPGTAIGWLLGLVGLLVAAEMLTEQYAIYGLITAPGSLPAVRLTGWFAEVVTYLTVFLLLLLVLTSVAGIPVAYVLAVLKYRLYDIDRLISRTLAYAIVTGLLVGLYAGLVLLATRVLPLHTPVAVAGSTLAAAALFSPLRRRVQRVVDSRFNRSRYDAEQMVIAFAARLQGATDLDTVRADLTVTVNRALEPAHVSLWFGAGPR
jgi:hypothetical protein